MCFVTMEMLSPRNHFNISLTSSSQHNTAWQYYHQQITRTQCNRKQQNNSAVSLSANRTQKKPLLLFFKFAYAILWCRGKPGKWWKEIISGLVRVRIDLALNLHEKTKYCERGAELHPCKHESTWCSVQQFTPKSLAILHISGCERRLIIVCSVWHIFRHVGRFIRHVPVSMRRINANVTGDSLYSLPNKGSFKSCIVNTSVFTTNTLFVWWYQWRVKMRFWRS